MAHRATAGPLKGDCYEAMTPAFCDGFEIRLGYVERDIAEAQKTVLLDAIQSRLQE